MSVERSCIHPFIERAQSVFAEGGSLGDVMQQIPKYQRKIEGLVTDISPEAKIPHMIGTSMVGLGLIASYEWMRSQGAPLPDSREFVGLMPVVSLSPQDDDYTTWAKEMKRRYPEDSNEHRKAAHGQADINVEIGKWTPEEAERAKRDWDKRHGY